MNDNTIKLQAFLSRAGIASRRASEQLIADGKVIVNNKIAHVGQRINPDTDTIEYNSEIISQPEKKRYFLVNKPTGYVSTTSDEEGRKTVLQLLPGKISERLYPVGRLDIESEGLLLLTNDGSLTYKLTHPKFEIPKTYHVFTKRKPSFNAIMHLRKGVKLTDGFTKPAQVERIHADETGAWTEITITEGRNRQVRRMFERVGYDVEQLIRLQIGPLHLDMLDDQPFLELSEETIKKLIE